MPGETEPQEIGIGVNQAAKQIAGILDDDGHFDSTGRVSRNHPEYDSETDPREYQEGQPRDSRGRYAKDDSEQQDLEPSDNLEDENTDLESDDSDPEDAETIQADAEDQEETADDDADSDDASTDGDIRTLSELAEALEVDDDQLKENLTVTFKAAGEETTVTLAELEKGYQKDADYRRGTQQNAEKARQLDARETERTSAYEQEAHANAQLVNTVEQVLIQELQDPRMQTLREVEPEEWSARQIELQQKIAAVQNIRQQAAAQYHAFKQQQWSGYKDEQLSLLKEKVPDWAPGHADTARSAFESLGYTPEEISTIADARAIQGAIELADLRKEVQRLRALEEKGNAAVKRLKKEVPKLQRPGKQKTLKGAAGIKRDNLGKAMTRLKKSHDVKDAAKVIENLL